MNPKSAAGPAIHPSTRAGPLVAPNLPRPPSVKLDTFIAVGGSDLGLKVKDLVDDARSIETAGWSLTKCPVLAAEQFDRWMHEQRYIESTTPEQALTSPMSDTTTGFLQQVLAYLPPMTPVAVRSTARSERGGIGIFDSTFLLLTGNPATDLPAAWQAVLQVYAGEFTGDALAWREKHSGPIGMAVMFHPVEGMWHGDYYFPVLSGRAYTSYFGEPRVHFVAGIATNEALAKMGDFASAPSGADL